MMLQKMTGGKNVNKLEQIYEGKAKKVFKTDDPELIDYVHSQELKVCYFNIDEVEERYDLIKNLSRKYGDTIPLPP